MRSSFLTGGTSGDSTATDARQGEYSRFAGLGEAMLLPILAKKGNVTNTPSRRLQSTTCTAQEPKSSCCTKPALHYWPTEQHLHV